jgi:hypothetical protein
MSRVEIQDAIIDTLEKVDEPMLLAVQQMLDTYVANRKVHSESDFHDSNISGKLMTSEDFADKIEAIDERMDAGEGTPADEVYKQAREWLRSTK